VAEATWSYYAASEAATDLLGRALAEALPRPAVIALHGTLGAGKTRLVRALAQGLGIDPDVVTSPTFVLLHEYSGETPLFHFDAYRLSGDEEFWQLGAEEYLDGRAGGITVIEWAERVAGCLPDERLEISIEVTGDSERNFSFAAHGEWYQAAIGRLKRSLADV
jgi:tRNA threonylcarbamoyladenosine biosynthesis protein TsaE